MASYEDRTQVARGDVPGVHEQTRGGLAEAAKGIDADATPPAGYQEWADAWRLGRKELQMGATIEIMIEDATLDGGIYAAEGVSPWAASETINVHDRRLIGGYRGRAIVAGTTGGGQPGWGPVPEGGGLPQPIQDGSVYWAAEDPSLPYTDWSDTSVFARISAILPRLVALP